MRLLHLFRCNFHLIVIFASLFVSAVFYLCVCFIYRSIVGRTYLTGGERKRENETQENGHSCTREKAERYHARGGEEVGVMRRGTEMEVGGDGDGV